MRELGVGGEPGSALDDGAPTPAPTPFSEPGSALNDDAPTSSNGV